MTDRKMVLGRVPTKPRSASSASPGTPEHRTTDRFYRTLNGQSEDAMAHDYDCPDLSPEEFQKAVMHDPTVPMELRLRAAEDLRGVPRSTVFDPVITIRIGGIRDCRLAAELEF
jgi:hypothetical protein